jgi:hypothetical protein
LTSPVNSGVPAATRNLPASLQGIYTALGLAFFAACLFFYLFFNSAAVQHDRANNPTSHPTWVPILLVSFLLLPIVICSSLLWARRGDLVAAGAGVACGYFGGLLIASPFALLMMVLFLGLSGSDHGFDHGLVLAGLALLALFAISLRIVRATWRIRQIEGNRSWLGSPRRRPMCSSALSSWLLLPAFDNPEELPVVVIRLLGKLTVLIRSISPVKNEVASPPCPKH